MISLVVATADRVGELDRLLASLVAQTYSSFEVIVVDQNPDDRLVPVLEPYAGSLSVTHLRTDRGLSRARNIGLRSARGDVIAFPDDDCWYPPTVLDRVVRFFDRWPEWAGLIVGGTADDQRSIFSEKLESGELSTGTLWRSAPSWTIFVRSQVVGQVGDFDETLGLGARTPWQSGEETDYLLRALRTGFRFWCDPSLVVGHPAWDRVFDAATIRRGYIYGLGMGRVMRKHRMPVWFVAAQVLRPLGGGVLAALSGGFDKARHRWAVSRGRLSGWLGGRA